MFTYVKEITVNKILFSCQWTVYPWTIFSWVEILLKREEKRDPGSLQSNIDFFLFLQFHHNLDSVFLFLLFHLGRAISYGSYFYNPNSWFSGILLFWIRFWWRLIHISFIIMYSSAENQISAVKRFLSSLSLISFIFWWKTHSYIENS